MKPLIIKAFKWVGVTVGALAGIWGAGWSSAMIIQTLFETQAAKAELRIEKRIDERESKIMGIHNADMSGINGKIDLLSQQNNTIIKQNYKIMKMIGSNP